VNDFVACHGVSRYLHTHPDDMIADGWLARIVSRHVPGD
jgi:hypothetical protein